MTDFSHCTEFVVTPGRSWMLQTDRIYYIHVEIFDKESRKLYPSEVCFVWFQFNNVCLRTL